MTWFSRILSGRDPDKRDPAGTVPSSLPQISFARYRILELIGAGGMGQVYKVYDIELGRVVAMKVMAMGEPTAARVKRFMREARAMARLRHPDIVAVHDVGHEGGVPFFTMDFIEGTTLKNWLRTRKLSLEQALQIAVVTGNAVSYAHEKGVVHRDLTPANIMLGPDGRPRLLDFGLAKLSETSSVTETGTIMGTLPYMPPEQVEGQIHDIDQLSDVYALGAILFEMLTHNPPFQGTPSSILYQVLHSDPAFPPPIAATVPLEIRASCLKALAKNKSDRYQSAAEFASHLAHIGGHSSGREIRKDKSRKHVFLSIVIAIVIVIAGGVWGRSFHAAPSAPDSKPLTTFRGNGTSPAAAAVLLRIEIDCRPSLPDPATSAVFLVDSSTSIPYQVRDGDSITPGTYVLKVECPGYDCPSREIQISTQSPIFDIRANPAARNRRVVFHFQDPGTEKSVLPLRLSIGGVPYSFEEKFPVAEKLRLKAEFREHRMVDREIVIPPGEGTFVQHILLER